MASVVLAAVRRVRTRAFKTEEQDDEQQAEEYLDPAHAYPQNGELEADVQCCVLMMDG